MFHARQASLSSTWCPVLWRTMVLIFQSAWLSQWENWQHKTLSDEPTVYGRNPFPTTVWMYKTLGIYGINYCSLHWCWISSINKTKKKVDCGIPNPVWYKVGEEPQLLRPSCGFFSRELQLFLVVSKARCVASSARCRWPRWSEYLALFFRWKKMVPRKVGNFLVQTVRRFQSTRTAQDIAMLKAWVLEMTVVGVSKRGIG